MAKVQTLPNGRRKIRFYDHRGERRAVHIGKVPLNTAESAASWIQRLVNDKIGGEEPRAAAVKWASDQKPRIYNYLAGIDLLPQRQAPEPEPEPEPVPDLQSWFDKYIQTRQAAESTKTVWKRAKRLAVEYFGQSRSIDSISTDNAIDWMDHLRTSDNLAESTARKMVSVLRHVFKRAVKAEHITSNPFHDEELPVTVGSRKKPYIEPDTIDRVLKILPSAEWRAVVVLARVAGLRVQSEAPLLKWTDIDWENGWFAVYSPKTRKTRQVPLFSDVRKALEDLQAVTGDGEYILNALREKSQNWRSPLRKMMERSGIEPWANLWNSLRASAASDICKQHGSAAESEWVGHSEDVSKMHYQRSTPMDHKRATESDPILVRYTVPSTPEAVRNDENNGGPDAGPRDAGHPMKHRETNKKRAQSDDAMNPSVGPDRTRTESHIRPQCNRLRQSVDTLQISGPLYGPVEPDLIAKFADLLHDDYGFTSDAIGRIVECLQRAAVEDSPVN